jgi:sugar/nucleoside kinase (ribokinase family)
VGLPRTAGSSDDAGFESLHGRTPRYASLSWLLPLELTEVHDHAEFKYLSHRTRLEPKDLPPPLRTAQYLHFVCSPTRALEIQAQLRPEDNSTPQWQPRLVYEPIPDRCRPDELDALRLVLPSIAVFSPNHEEAWAFFGVSAAEANRRGRPGVEEVARKFLEEGAADLVVIRSGPMGAYALRRSGGAEEDAAAAAFWVPAYHSYETGKSTGKVVDVTGAGNSFLVRSEAKAKKGCSRDVRDTFQLTRTLSMTGRSDGGIGAIPG